MRRGMLKELNIFIDPKTKEKLALKIQQESGVVITGKLYSDRHSYPVISGIPRFVGKSFTQGGRLILPNIRRLGLWGEMARKRNRALGCSKEDVEI